MGRGENLILFVKTCTVLTGAVTPLASTPVTPSPVATFTPLGAGKPCYAVNGGVENSEPEIAEDMVSHCGMEQESL